MSTVVLTSKSRFDDWNRLGHNEEMVVHLLKEQQVADYEIQQVCEAYKKYLREIRSRKGFILMAIGSFLGFTSCVLTVFDVMPELRIITLYGLTTVGVSLAFYGAYLVFE